MTPDPRPNGDIRAQLQAHLKVTLERRPRDRKRACPNGIALEAVHHGVEVPLLRRLHGGRRRPIRRELEDRVVRVMLLHRVQVIGAFEEMGALAARVLRAYGLTVDALRRKTLA